jgi:hypothetical protein
MVRARILGALVLVVASGGPVRAASMNGVAGVMPAFYDGALFTINFKELSPRAEAATLAHNGSLNVIYMCDACEDGLPGGFVSVIDAIQGDGFNPLWQEVQVVFNQGFSPRQLTSDEDILDAVAAGEVTLEPTDEVYRCSVIGAKR